ncbi:MAG: HAD family hydrolase [Solirubrobacteraceae bacterium]
MVDERLSDGTLVLWDIDGTLIHEAVAADQTYAEAVQRVLPAMDVSPPSGTSGGTDFGILLGVLLDAGVSDQQAALLLPAALFELEQNTTSTQRLQDEREVAEGVLDALSELSGLGAMQSVVTGNSRARAAAKLKAFGLTSKLDMRFGGFGDRDRERWRLVSAAMSIAGLMFENGENAISAERTFVIGDTVHDVRAAREAGAVAIAIASGSDSEATLAEAGPDLLLQNLTVGLPALVSRVAGT